MIQVHGVVLLASLQLVMYSLPRTHKILRQARPRYLFVGQQIDNNSDGDAWENYNSSFYAQSGTFSAALYTDFNGGNNDDYLITPGFVVTGGEQLIYSYRVRAHGEPNDFEVVLSTTGTTAATLQLR